MFDVERVAQSAVGVRSHVHESVGGMSSDVRVPAVRVGHATAYALVVHVLCLDDDFSAEVFRLLREVGG